MYEIMLNMPNVVLASTFALALTAGVGAQSGWTLRTPTVSPSLRGFHNLVHDLGRGVTVLFGGWDGSYLGDTWEWNGTTWLQRTPANAPSPRLAYAMAYDVARARVVLFGGAIGTGAGTDDDETWEYDGTNWQQLTPAIRPSPRRGVDMTFDVTRGVCVLFGGGLTAFGSTVYDDTWEWNGSTWTQANPAVRPPARWNCFLVGDWANGHVVMFGGGVGTATNQTFDDTWTWNGTSWQQRSPLTTPTARRYGGAAYDVQRSLVVTWGGMLTAGVANAGTWVWNGADWRLDPRPPAPPARWATALAYDLARGRTVMFGGYSQAGMAVDTWEYEASTPANWSIAGGGCAGAAGTPTLAPQFGLPPVLGSIWTLQLTYGAGNGIAALAVGTSNTAWFGGTLPQDLAAFGAPGCTLRTSTDWLGAVALVSGTGVVPWTLPSSPTLVGLPFFAQALVLEPGANPLGGVLSNAIAGVTGAY
ncbi:MAG: hypothetical protein WAT39_15290 [Planctomycetota bacterium]